MQQAAYGLQRRCKGATQRTAAVFCVHEAASCPPIWAVAGMQCLVGLLTRQGSEDQVVAHV